MQPRGIFVTQFRNNILAPHGHKNETNEVTYSLSAINRLPDRT